jgi:hypothetical protein
MRFVERYQRFALSDIQAIVVTEGGRRAVWQSATLLLCLVFATSVTSTFARDFWGIVGSIALALVILDIARGPRCRCFVQTAVSHERLLCVSRMRTARSFLAKVAPAIELIQGTIPVGDLPLLSVPAPSTAPVSAPMPQPPAIERPLGYAPEVLFAVLILDSILMFTALRSTIGVAFSLLPIVYFAEFVIGILALIQARARNATVVTVLVAAFLCVLIDPFVLSGPAVWPGILASVRAASSGNLPWSMPVGDSMRTTLFSAGWRAGIAVTGLLVCYFERTASRN